MSDGEIKWAKQDRTKYVWGGNQWVKTEQAKIWLRGEPKGLNRTGQYMYEGETKGPKQDRTKYIWGGNQRV